MLVRHALLCMCIAVSLLAVLFYQPHTIRATSINAQQILSQHATDRFDALVTLALQNHDRDTISSQMAVHLPVINKFDVYYRADGKHDLEATTHTPCALISYSQAQSFPHQETLSNNAEQTSAPIQDILLSNGAICPIDQISTEKLTAPLVHVPSAQTIAAMSLRTRIAYARWVPKLPEWITQHYSLNLLDKTRFVLAAHDKASELWCTSKTTHTHLTKALECMQKSIETSKERRPHMRIADLRTPRTIVIKNKSKGWVIV
ncbi:MAG: hypothetical protein UU47_C0005G0037 [candidate division TM6 bacterium GW2011_GWE2_41_16]|nr:MAG: hypothetical protein UU47_C0005G0037 [candidate division TM6 bacterium GW2011_GWE2_41_16]